MLHTLAGKVRLAAVVFLTVLTLVAVVIITGIMAVSQAAQNLTQQVVTHLISKAHVSIQPSVIRTMSVPILPLSAATLVMPLVGVLDEVAQTLVGLGLNLDGLRTSSSLQSGIAATRADNGIW